MPNNDTRPEPNISYSVSRWYLRAVCLERAPRLSVVWDGIGLFKLPQAYSYQCVLGRRLVQGIRNPGVPARFDLCGVIVMLGIFDPSRAKGQFFQIFEVFVTRTVGAYQSAIFGVA